MKKIIHDYLKIKILIITFVFSSYVNAQQANLSRELLTFPVSPEASKLGVFGNETVNLSTGQLGKSIELFNGKIGDYSVPINLSYNYAGNRVEEEPSIIGLGWQLNMGGVITREVRGLPDEIPGFGYFDPSVQSLLTPFFDSGIISDITSEKIISGHLDSEVDKYFVNVNGINFAFKIGFDGLPTFLSLHDYKIEIIRGTNITDNINQKEIIRFILTDTNSNKYYFDQRELTTILNDDDFFNSSLNYISSWQLSKIILNNNSVINYTYQDDSYSTKSFHASLSVSKDQLFPEIDNYSEGFSEFSINRKLLSNISCDNFNINFEITNINNQDVYNKITIKDFLNSNVHIYDFTYTYVRNCLTKINKNSQFFYEFDYNPITDPFIINDQSIIKKQDYWGFSNGANNSCLINGPDNSLYKSNRNPNFFKTSEGALIKIKYPTGGITNINYEQNTVSGGLEEISIVPNINMTLKFKSDNSYSEPNYKEVSLIKTFTTDVIADLSHTISNTNYINVMINSIAPNQCTTGTNYYNDVAGTSVLPQICLRLNDLALLDGCTLSDCSISKSSGKRFKIQAGTYEFKISTNYNYLNLNAEISLDYFEESLNLYNSNNNSDIGGIRIKSINDISYSSDVTYYYYDYNNDADSSTGSILNDTEKSYDTKSVPPSTTVFPYSMNGVEVANFSKSGFNFFTNSNSPIFYQKVREAKAINRVLQETTLQDISMSYRGKNWDNSYFYSFIGGSLGTIKKEYPYGYKESIFEKPYNIFFEYPYSPSGKDLSVPRELGNSVLSESDINYTSKVLMEQNNAFFNMNPINASIVNVANHPKSLKVGYILNKGLRPMLPNTSIYSYYLFQTYRENDYEFFKSQANTKESFNNQFVEKNVTFEYNSHYKQNKITSSDSNNNVLTNELYYPYDFTDTTSQDMVIKNCIAPIVKIVNKKNGSLIDSYKYDFTTIGSNLFKPSIFWKSKANGALEKLSAYGYDNKGNVNFIQNIESETQVPPHTITNGPTTVVIWGYNDSQPIAKIENVAGVTISQSLINDAKDKSNTGTEAQLITSLNNLRNSLPNAMVTTYTHKPLVGVSTITDPKGDTLTYVYDSFNRLKEVKDKNGNKLSENEYHYKP